MLSWDLRVEDRTAIDSDSELAVRAQRNADAVNVVGFDLHVRDFRANAINGDSRILVVVEAVEEVDRTEPRVDIQYAILQTIDFVVDLDWI